jgi:mono/diheme cytochrome c family protein
MKHGLILALTLSALLLGCERAEGPPDPAPAALEEQVDYESDEIKAALAKPPVMLEVEMPEPNPRRGRILFITNGCVICHQVNSVGGSAGPRLDLAEPTTTVDPLEFSARIWRGARAMTALQSIELGYVIELEGEDIADIAAFVASKDERGLLTLDSVSTEMRDWFINEPYWIDDEWDEYLEKGEQIPLDGAVPQ